MPEPIPSNDETALEKPKRKLPRRRSAPTKASFSSSSPSTNKEIDDCLASIYQDHSGKIPNMKKIDIKKNNPIAKFFSRLFVLGITLAAIAWIVWYIAPGSNKSATAPVVFTITGPEHPTLGTPSTYTITYENNDSQALHDVSLQAYYPTNFVVQTTSLAPTNAKKSEWSIGVLQPHQRQTLSITGSLYGRPNQDQPWRVFLNYRPESFNSPLQKVASLSTSLNDSPYTLTLSGPSEGSIGTTMAYTLTLSAQGAWPDGTLELAPTVPSNFVITSSSPVLSKNNRWLFSGASSTLVAAQNIIPLSATNPQVTITLVGVWNAVSASSSAITVGLFIPVPGTNDKTLVANTSLTTELNQTDVGVDTAINGIVGDFTIQPGGVLNTTIQVKNNTATDIKNATLQIIFDSPAIKKQTLINWPELNDQHNGDVIGKQISDTRRAGTITWTSKQVPELAKLKAGQSVSLDLQLPLRDSKGIALDAITENTIIATAQVTYTNSAGISKTITGSPATITVNSDLTFAPQTDATTDQGKKRYNVTWVLNNNFHPLKNIFLSASLYGDSTWQTNGDVSSGKLTFDDVVKKVTWDIAAMPTSVDVASAPFSITLNTENPTQNTLLSKVTIHADDTVTGKPIELVGDEVSLK